MKKNFLIVLVTLFHFISFAQQVELSSKPAKTSSFKKVATTADGHYLVGESGDYVWLVKTDFNGNFLWQQDIFGNDIIDLKAKPNGDVVVISSNYVCGWVYYEDVKLQIFNSAGNEILEKDLFSYWFGADDYVEPHTKTTKTSTGVDWRLLFNGDSIYKVNDLGEIIFRMGTPDNFWGIIVFAIIDSQDRIVVSLDNGSVHIANNTGEYVSNFEIEWGYIVATEIKEAANGNYVMRGNDGSLFIYDYNDITFISQGGIAFYQLDSLDIYSFYSGTLSITDENGHTFEQVNLSYDFSELDELISIHKRNDTLYLIGNENFYGVVFIVDEGYNLVNSFSIPWVKINDCEWNDSLILLLGEEIYRAGIDWQSNLVNLPSALFKSVDYQLNTLAPEYDAAILSCSMDTSYVTWSPTYDRVYTSLAVTVANNGQTELNKATVSLHYETMLWDNSCDYNVNLYELSNLHLLPGNDTVVTLGPVMLLRNNETYTINLTTCAYVYSPNERMDADHNNNKCCTNHSISLGLDDVQKQSLNLYPNPATNQVFIQSSEKIISISIYDIVGRQIDNRIWKKENSTVDVSGLEKGVYVFVINNSVSRKVVVE